MCLIYGAIFFILNDKNLDTICNRFQIFSTDRVIGFGAYSHWNRVQNGFIKAYLRS